MTLIAHDPARASRRAPAGPARRPGTRRRRLVALTTVLVTLGWLMLGSGCDDGPSPTPPARAASPDPTFPSTGPAPHHAPGDKRPNIVLVSADDMRADEMQFMPQTERLLGRHGLTLTDALSPHPLCCPARAELLTGQYAQNNGVRSNTGPLGGFHALDRRNTIGTWLNGAGYNTAFLGKHLNSTHFFREGRDPGWTLFNASEFGYTDYYDFVQYDNGERRRVDGQYYTDYLAQRSRADVHQLSAYDAPFFMWVSHFGPHSAQDFVCEDGSSCRETSPPALSPSYRADAARVARDRRIGRARTERLLATPSFREKDRADKQHYVRTQVPPTAGEVRKLVTGRIGALRSLDDAVAGLIRQLAADRELDNTYLVFITDNGYMLGEHAYVGKILGYEPSLRSPMLVRGPGVKAGSTSSSTATIVDLPATFLDLAGARSNLTIDGRSLAPLWHDTRGRRPLHPGGVLIQAGPVAHETNKRDWYFRGIRTDRYTYMRFDDGFVELYDRRRDPQQMRSVSADPRYRRVLVELARRTRALSDCNGPDACSPAFGGKVPGPTSRPRGRSGRG